PMGPWFKPPRISPVPGQGVAPNGYTIALSDMVHDGPGPEMGKWPARFPPQGNPPSVHPLHGHGPGSSRGLNKKDPWVSPQVFDDWSIIVYGMLPAWVLFCCQDWVGNDLHLGDGPHEPIIVIGNRRNTEGTGIRAPQLIGIRRYGSIGHFLGNAIYRM